VEIEMMDLQRFN